MPLDDLDDMAALLGDPEVFVQALVCWALSWGDGEYGMSRPSTSADYGDNELQAIILGTEAPPEDSRRSSGLPTCLKEKLARHTAKLCHSFVCA
ncbi:hypothetical protein [Nonomuraea roseoviolacea]|uniref:hypothetical protein n=1 Tax=Nonomuraea roseoviolacea TaxID=103837 RepID=UPI0031D15A08